MTEICPKCGKNPAAKPHTCPIREEIQDDYETLCTCCPSCESECNYNI